MAVYDLKREDLIDKDKKYSDKALAYIEMCLSNPIVVPRSGAVDSGWVSLVKVYIDVLLKLEGLEPKNDMPDVDI